MKLAPKLYKAISIQTYMMHVIITAYEEPKATEQAVNALLNQETKEKFKVIVTDPFPEVEEFIINKFSDKVEFILDEGEGKSYALNMILRRFYSENKDDILIFTDGDVYTGKTAIQFIVDGFKDPEIGVICGKPVSLNPRNNKFGFWSQLLFTEMDKTRKRLSSKKEFFEASGYLFAIRNGVLTEFPTEASEDNVIPILFWKKGYKIKYVPAEVFVLNPQNKKDWLNQKKRNIKGHIALQKIFQSEIIGRKNTFFGEAFRGVAIFFTFPKNPKEFFWTIELMFMRLQAWKLASKEKDYKDGWREEEIGSTKPLD